MSKNNPDFYSTAKEIWKTVVKTDAPTSHELQLQLEFHKRLLNIFHVGSYYYFVFNIYSGEIEFMSAGITKVLGYTPEEVTVAFLMDKIHPEDRPYFLNYEHKIATFFKGLPFEKIKNYKAQYDYRLKNKDNKYVRILHQAVQVEYDETNFYRTFDLQTDITHLKPDGLPTFSIIGLDGEPSYYNITDQGAFTQSYDQFTKREREILKYIVEGKSSKAIADDLYLSLHTVNTHRKNILNKANCKTPVDLVSKALSEGWI